MFHRVASLSDVCPVTEHRAHGRPTLVHQLEALTGLSYAFGKGKKQKSLKR